MVRSEDIHKIFMVIVGKIKLRRTIMESVVEINNLIKRYKEKLALNGLNLTLKKGTILGLIGPNGSGKTTAINCLLGLLNYDSGDIKVFGGELKTNSYDKNAESELCRKTS